MKYYNHKLAEKCENTYLKYIEEEELFVKKGKEGNRATITKAQNDFRAARLVFYEAIADYLTDMPRYKTLLAYKWQLVGFLEHLWVAYFQDILISSGSVYDIPDYDHRKELLDEVEGYEALKKLIKSFDLGCLRNSTFPIDIKYGSKVLVSTNSIRVWSRIFELFEAELIAKQHFLRNARKNNFKGDTAERKDVYLVLRPAMTREIYDFLNKYMPMKPAKGQIPYRYLQFICELYTRLEYPLYKGSKLSTKGFSPQVILGDLKGYTPSKLVPFYLIEPPLI